MRKFIIKSSVVAAMAVAAAASVQAAPVLSLVLQDTTNGVTLTCDNSTAASVAACTLAGFVTAVNSTNISYIGSVGQFAVSQSFSTTNNPGTAIEASLDQTANRVRWTGAGFGDFYIDLTAYNFTQPAGPLRNLQGSSGSSTGILGAGGMVTNRYYADGTNSGAASNEISCSYAVAISTNCNAGSTQWVGGTPFSLREVQQFRLGSGQDVNTTSNLTVTIPEPVSTTLVGAGLLALALTSRRRAAK